MSRPCCRRIGSWAVALLLGLTPWAGHAVAADFIYVVVSAESPLKRALKFVSFLRKRFLVITVELNSTAASLKL